MYVSFCLGLSVWLLTRLSQSQLASRDPRRNQVLVDWIKNIPQEFSRFSAFDSR
jgi:type IV secretory pathway TrbD component